MNIKGQGQSKVTQIQQFPSKHSRPTEAKFHFEPPRDIGMKIY